MKDSQKFVGLDVSKEFISVGIAEEGRGETRFHGNIQNNPENTHGPLFINTQLFS